MKIYFVRADIPLPDFLSGSVSKRPNTISVKNRNKLRATSEKWLLLESQVLLSVAAIMAANHVGFGARVSVHIKVCILHDLRFIKLKRMCVKKTWSSIQIKDLVTSSPYRHNMQKIAIKMWKGLFFLQILSDSATYEY